MATSIVLDGITFTDTDFAGLGYTDSVIVDGTAYPRFQALFVAALNQIESDTVGVSGQAIAIRWTFQDPTTDSDPGSGNFQLDNASFSSVTEIYVDDVDASGNTVEPIVATWDDSTSSVKGVLGIIDPSAPTRFAYYQVTGITNNSGYKTIAVTHIASNGSLTDGTAYTISFGRTGDKGDTGDVTDISALMEKTTPVAADLFVLGDSEDSDTTKKVTLENLQTVLGGAGGANVETLSANKTLTASDARVQRLDPNGTTRTVAMPAANTPLNEGGPLFIIHNTGSDANLFVQDNGGGLLGFVEPGEILNLFLADNSTAAGTWTRFKGVNPTGFEIIATDVFESADSTFICADALTSTKVIFVYRDGGNSNNGTAIVIDYSTSTIGSPVVFNAAATSEISVARITDTTAIVTYANSTSSGDAKVLSVSGTTITANTVEVFESAQVYYTSVCVNSTTLAMVSYRDEGNSGRPTAVSIDISGTSLNANTPIEIEAVVGQDTALFPISATTSLMCYSESTNNTGQAVVLTDTAGTLSKGTAEEFDGSAVANLDCVVLSSTRGLVFYEADATTNDPAEVVPLTLSGTSVTAGSPVVVQTPASSGTSQHNISRIDDDTSIASHSDDGAGVTYIQKILWNSGTPLVNNQKSLAINNDDGANSRCSRLPVLSSSQVVIPYRDGGNSNYGTAALIREFI